MDKEIELEMNLDELRSELTQLDAEILTLVARRQALSEQVAAVKRATGRATRDFAREREVIVRGRQAAERLGLKPDLAESLLRQLIQSSLTTQEQARVAAQGQGAGKRALLIGGRGKMGAWFTDFLASQGFQVTIADPRGGLPGFDQLDDWRDDPLDCELIVLATPLSATAEILKQLALLAPRGLIFDLGSLKTPLRSGLDALVKAGCRVTSLHPMFGPDTQLLSGRHVIFIDLGDAEALREAQELFAPTMAERVVMGLDEHDRLIAYVLGLSHALNIAFFTALADSGEAALRLARLSSTTFDSQMEVASRVAAESPDLYFEIQSLNEHGAQSLMALEDAVGRLVAAVQSKDADAFTALMLRGRAYFDARAQARGD
ncbi:MAG TPA: prephenate dehydrogenase/arogenate dehydrogenase family protein [Steroidobacteraceae bacterium]|nr:prephenate dehydrogenase/arogenate dehydrogenase family protein [Steroidobacteraceae bacterium]